MNSKPMKATLIDLLRHIPRDAWAEVTESNGWSYNTNIGKLVNDAADELERLSERRTKPMSLFECWRQRVEG